MMTLVSLLMALCFIAGILIGYDYSKTKWQSKIDLFRGEKVKAENEADQLRKELNRAAADLELIARFNSETA